MPVSLGPDERPDEMVTSDAYKTLTKALWVLRAHDTDIIAALADPASAGRGAERGGQGTAVQRGTTPRGLARSVRLRVIDPECAHRPRGIGAATGWLRETGNGALRVPYTVITPEDWRTVGGGYPLGQWIAEQRHANRAG
ncbi:helicase associated domain-containing protein [Streptomyces sp. NBC_01767]|uniref:helicase associated domain-containing protein n=1 Tax=Streptomyces sp. NBC_01767 TaxID=2975937 RepID=UPI0022538764|nr:helicase associated domain-containing protein [Streptomyces sp. NBC_01767]MCX4391546.1 helicase associated domain-containing protein [Streptomyces sp. NBC_01767]